MALNGVLDTKELSIRLYEARTAAGMRMIDLQRETGIDAGQLSRYECEVKEPSLRSIMRIADALHVDLEYLCGLQDMPRRADSIEC